MQSNGAKAAVAILSLAVIVVLFVVLSGGDDESTTTTTTTELSDATGGAGKPARKAGGKPARKAGDKPDAGADVPVIKVVDGQPQGGITELEVSKGEDIRFEVDSDTAAEVHVHGYDVMQDVEAGGKAEFDFPAEIDGVFEIELEQTATQIAELTVNP